MCADVRILLSRSLMDPIETALPEEESQSIATSVREALARRRISRQMLADQAKISISTLEKALSGRRPFTLATTIRLEEALGTRLRGALPKPVSAATPRAEQAPAELGSYSRAAVSWIEGSYLTLRPSFGGQGAVFAYLTAIVWDEANSRLIFKEAERLDAAFTQTGYVSVPNESGHIYLVTNFHGQYRVAVLGRPTIRKELYGLLTTLREGRGSHLTPTAVPLALVPAGAEPLQYGRIMPSDRCFADYKRHIDRIRDDGFAEFLIDF